MSILRANQEEKRSGPKDLKVAHIFASWIPIRFKL